MTRKRDVPNYRQIFEDGENELEISAYKKDTVKTTLTYLGYLVSFGLLRLFYHWYPHLLLISTHRVTRFEEGEKILVVDKYKGKHKTYFVEKLEDIEAPNVKISFALSNGQWKNEAKVRRFHSKKNCYVFDDETGLFFKLVGINHSVEKSKLFQSKGYEESSRPSRSVIYGKNSIEVPFETVLKLFVLEALTPFYIFQLFSLIVWFAEQYYYYTIAIVVMSAYGISSSVIQTRRNQRNLRGTVEKTDYVDVLSDGMIAKLESTELVPGDVIVIPKNGCILHCDAVLLNGSCVVNESMLTGESVPVLKTALEPSDTFYNEKVDSNHTLYCGTTVIQGRSNNSDLIKAVVVRTGFLTSKGELVKSILYPPPADFKFETDSYKYIGILALVALAGFVYTIVSKSYRNIAVWDTIIKALDIITITIPPALPAALTIGKLYALNRLKQKDIFCMNSRVINISGAIDCVCFDKTGTLTEDGLDLYGVVLKENADLKGTVEDPKDLPVGSEMLKAMATCHSLNVIDKNLSGDPLDIKMFESTEFDFDSTFITNRSGEKLEITRQNQFSSNLQRMSVIVRDHVARTETVYCKGSPETIVKLSIGDSVPGNFDSTLNVYTEKGYRVLAVAAKTLGIHDERTRDSVESRLNFLGLLIFENKLKTRSAEIVDVLKRARMKVVMITGDNVQTAVSVAKECGIIEKNSLVADVEVRNVDKLGEPELTFNFDGKTETKGDGVNLTVTGQNWLNLRQYFPAEIPKIVTQGTVFARMGSDQKQQLILELQSLGYYVAMCGDGTNDCGALKAAHVGISLSEADASVASPFTSKTPDVSCVREVIKEGRAALVTSFGVFKFMLCYSLTELISVVILYGIDANLTSLQFLFIDICLVLNFASLFGYTKAYTKELYPKPPCISLLSFIPLMSLIVQTLLVVVFQTISYFVIQLYDFYEPFVYDPDKHNYYVSFENYAVFSVSLFQYIVIAIVFSKGKPYRKTIFTNYYLLTSLVLMTLICSYMTLWPADWIIDVLEMKAPPNVYAGSVILLLAGVNFLLAYLLEDFFVDYFLGNKIRPLLFKNKAAYLTIQENLKCTGWIGNPNRNVSVQIDNNDYNCYYNKAYVKEKL